MSYEVIESWGGSVWYIYVTGSSQKVAAVTLNMFNDAEKCRSEAQKIVDALNEYEVAHA